jgi:hypothetical protein
LTDDAIDQLLEHLRWIYPGTIDTRRVLPPADLRFGDGR